MDDRDNTILWNLVGRILTKGIDAQERAALLKEVEAIERKLGVEEGFDGKSLSEALSEYEFDLADSKYVHFLRVETAQTRSSASPESDEKQVTEHSPAPPPSLPAWGERLMRLTCSSEDVEAMLGDQAERYGRRLERDGPASARRWYRKELAKSISAFLWRWTQRFLAVDALFNRLG